MLNPTQRSLLRTMLQLAREDRPADLSLLAAKLGISCVQADTQLEQLERLGLVDAERVRLTMYGLAIAASTPDARRRSSTGTAAA